MKGNFLSCLAFTLKYEGGYADHPRDPGGATNYGITRATLARWRKRPVTKAEVKALSKKEAAEIYEAYYWKPVRGDELPLGVDLCVFDYGVNSGASRGAIALQRCVGVADDGRIGPVTLKATKEVLPAVLADRVCAERLRFLTHLSTWRVFGKGWKRRVDACEQAAAKMVPTSRIRGRARTPPTAVEPEP
jgi:lysozyme family protein